MPKLLGIFDKIRSRSRSPSPSRPRDEGDGGASAPRKSVPAMPSFEVQCCTYTNLTENPFSAYVADGKAREHAAKFSLPASGSLGSAPGNLLVMDKEGGILLDTKLVSSKWRYRTVSEDSKTGSLIVIIDVDGQDDVLLAQVSDAVEDVEPSFKVADSRSSTAPPSVLLPSPSASMRSPSALLAPPLASMCAGDMAGPSASMCAGDMAEEPERIKHRLTMSLSDTKEAQKLLQSHGGEEMLSSCIDDFGPEMMVMTIGQYVDPAQKSSAGTTWLLRGDVSEAKSHDVAEIYRCLGSNRRNASVGFREFPDRCFVGPELRAHLMRRLDEAFVASGGVDKDTKLDLTREELEALVGSQSLSEIKETFGARIDKIKMRRVCAHGEVGTGHVINFHLDKFAKTMGIPLNDDSEYDGSRLIFALPDSGKLVQPNRRAGSATVHDNRIAHGVTPITRGVRYGLFLLSHSSSFAA